MAKRPSFGLTEISRFLNSVFKERVHAKRIESMANATLGIMTSPILTIHGIGQALAEARGLDPKHAIKQVDRLLSNDGINVWSFFTHWVLAVVGVRKEVMVAMDWTDFDADGQTTLALNLVTRHGRATPLIWLTVHKHLLADQRNDFEDRCLRRLDETVPDGVRVTILADRGFGDHKLFRFLMEDLDFDYVIRIRDNILVTDTGGETRPASEWVGKGGRARTLRNARVTGQQFEVPTVVCVHDRKMKDPWCLCASDPTLSARTLIAYYAKRWSIEPHFRDTKDLRFGKGLSATHIGNPARRDRMLLLNAFAVLMVTLLGAAGEALGIDRTLKANTVKSRTLSLFRQGCRWFAMLPTMPPERLRLLLKEFRRLLASQRHYKGLFGAA